jgi:DNA polymerase-4
LEAVSGPTDVLHVDMDAFYASVEMLDNPSLAGLPLIVGGEGPRGVVASCSYEARAYGVRSAMPSVRARRLCPQAVFVAGRHGRYSEVSGELHRIFEDFTPLVEPVALDEAYLDVSGSHLLFGESTAIAAAIRDRVAADLRLSCSVGVGRTKLVAKLASRAAKPSASPAGVVAGRGVFVVMGEEEVAFLHRLPASAIPGVGQRTAERLTRYGVSTIGDLAKVGEDSLKRLLGSAHGSQLHALAWGRDERAVVPDRPLKSVGHEETFAFDDRDMQSLQRQAVRMSDSVASRMRGAGVVARTVTIKVRFADFKTITRSRTLPVSTSSGLVVARVASALLDEVPVGRGVRLLGVSVSGLVARAAGGAEQLSFDSFGSVRGSGDERGGGDETRENVDDAVDAVRRRFGADALAPASLVSSGRLNVKRPGEGQWGPAATEER